MSIQLLFRMNFLMRDQVGSLVETLSAHRAQEGFLPCVNFQVSDTVVVTNEALATMRA